MRNRFKIILSMIVVLIILCLLILVSLSFQNNDKKIKYETLDTIHKYNYTLQDRDSELMKEVFNNLKDTLEKDEIDYELYAEYLSKLFIIDLFTLNNKDNKYDVGSLEYIFDDVLENYRLNVEDTLYKYIVDINSEDRQNNLPIVKSITKESLENTIYTYEGIEYDSYKINLSWDYEKDYEYPTNGEIILIKEDNKLSVVSYKGVD